MDRTLYKEICLSLNVTKRKNISDEDFKKVNMLLLENRNVKSINGIEKMTNLKILNLSNTKITNIDALKNNETIEKLAIMNTKIMDLSPIFSMKNLKELYLNHKLSSDEWMKLSKMSSLRKLSIKLYSFNLEGMPNFTFIEELQIGSKKEVSLKGIENFPKLRKLILLPTKIYDIESLESLTNFEEIKSVRLNSRQVDFLKENDISINHKFKIEDVSISVFKNNRNVNKITRSKYFATISIQYLGIFLLIIGLSIAEYFSDTHIMSEDIMWIITIGFFVLMGIDIIYVLITEDNIRKYRINRHYVKALNSNKRPKIKSIKIDLNESTLLDDIHNFKATKIMDKIYTLDYQKQGIEKLDKTYYLSYIATTSKNNNVDIKHRFNKIEKDLEDFNLNIFLDSKIDANAEYELNLLKEDSTETSIFAPKRLRSYVIFDFKDQVNKQDIKKAQDYILYVKSLYQLSSSNSSFTNLYFLYDMSSKTLYFEDVKIIEIGLRSLALRKLVKSILSE